MTTQTPLSADRRTRRREKLPTPSDRRAANHSSSLQPQASSFQNLIANLELEFRPTHRKISPLKISNRKYLAIFHPNSQARSRATSPNFQNGNSFCSTPIVYPELRRVQPRPRKLSSLQPQPSSLQILIANGSRFRNSLRDPSVGPPRQVSEGRPP